MCGDRVWKEILRGEKTFFGQSDILIVLMYKERRGIEFGCNAQWEAQQKVFTCGDKVRV